MMSLGLYSNVWRRLIIIGTQVYSRRVNMKIWSGVPSSNRTRHQLSCLLVLRLLSYIRVLHGQNGKNIFEYNIHIWCSFTEIFGILFSFHI